MLQNNSFKGRIRDRTAVVVDNRQLGFLYYTSKELTLDFANDSFTKSGNEYILDLIVENMGRDDWRAHINTKVKRKGLFDNILIDNKVQKNWEIFPLDFKHDFINKLKNEK